MSDDAKSFTLTIALFYAIGIILAVRAYAQNSIDDFSVVAEVWIKGTVWPVLCGLIYWLFCIILTAFGRPTKSPFRNVHLCFLMYLVVELHSLRSVRTISEATSSVPARCILAQPPRRGPELDANPTISDPLSFYDCRYRNP
jgi:hypothetical protein